MLAPRQIHHIRRISQASIERFKPIPSDRLIWKANEDDPRKHTTSHEGLFYQLPQDEKELNNLFGYPSPYDIETTRFYNIIGMMPLMIRSPALNAMQYLRKVKQSKPNVRLLFYGDKGQGKTHTLTHLIHYLHLNQEHIIVHLREMKRFTRSPMEYSASNTRPGRINTNLNAALFLSQFRKQNANLLKKHKSDLVSSQSYKWSLREVTEAGEPIDSIISHGINRVMHASDCVAVLLKELCSAADSGKIKLASILDNVKFLFDRETGTIKHADNKMILVDEITVARALKKLIKGSHKNGIVLATCDDKLSKEQNQTPGSVIGPEGWQHFDPFLPIHVPKYSRKEFESCLNFYQDIGWLCRPESKTEKFRDELRFISGSNPFQVFYNCRGL